MYRGNRVVALVPARAGSKGLPRKNLQRLAGRTLLAWTVELATSLEAIDRCVVSTDGEEIAREARRLGAEVHDRPGRLATDDALVIDTVRDVLAAPHADGGPSDILVLLQPTSPLRSDRDVTDCLDALVAGADSAVTVTEARLHPQRAFRIVDGVLRPYLDDASPWRPRQALSPPAVEVTGAVYAFWVDRLPADGAAVLFGTVHPVATPRARSVDIDDAVDLAFAEALVHQAPTADDEQATAG